MVTPCLHPLRHPKSKARRFGKTAPPCRLFWPDRTFKSEPKVQPNQPFKRKNLVSLRSCSVLLFILFCKKIRGEIQTTQMDVINRKRGKFRSQSVLENFQGMKMMGILNSHHHRSLFKGCANFNTNSGWLCWFGAALNGKDSKVTRLHVERGESAFSNGKVGQQKCCSSGWKMWMFRGVCSCQRICSQGFPQVFPKDSSRGSGETSKDMVIWLIDVV